MRHLKSSLFFFVIWLSWVLCVVLAQSVLAETVLVTSSHYRLTAGSSRVVAEEMVQRLEEVYSNLSQLFKTTQPAPQTSSASLFLVRVYRDRREYIAAVRGLDAGAARAWGYYDSRSRVCHLFPPDPHTMDAFDQRYVADTLLHEATHQWLHRHLGCETSSAMAGENNNYWMVEGIAIYLEMQQRDVATHDRMKAARYRYAEGFYIPLAEFAAMGSREFCSSPRVERLYSQSAGVTAFLMTFHRDTLLSTIRDVYAGISTPDTLATRTGIPFTQLDTAYREWILGNVTQ